MAKFKKIVWIVAFILLLWLGFYLFFVLPFPWYDGENLSLKEGKESRQITFDLIDHIRYSQPVPEGGEPWIRPDLTNGGWQVSLGKYMWMVETRRALPANRILTFSYTASPTSVLVFGTGVKEQTSRFEIRVDRQTVFSTVRSPAPDRKANFFNRFFQFFRFRFSPQKGFWLDHQVSLARWAGRLIEIELIGDQGFWASPVITEASPEKPERPNVILLQVDALRSDVVARGELAEIGRLKNEGFYFENAYAPANWTRPSNLQLLFARASIELGINNYEFYLNPMEKNFFYQNRFVSLPVIFARAGYCNAAIGDNIFLHGFSEWGLDIGFSEVKDFEKLKYESAYIADEVIRWLNKKKGLPFFLFVDFNQTHSPYKPPLTEIDVKEFIRDPRYALYLGCNKYVDRFIGKIISALKAGGLLHRTLLIITGDHGENFANFGRRKLKWNGEWERIREHGYSLWQEEIRVPLIFYWPGKIAPAVAKEKVSLLDVPKTLLSLVGWPIPQDWKGRDLARQVRGEEKASDSEPVVVEGRNEISLIKDHYQYISGYSHRRLEELYDIEKDPENRRNLLKQVPWIADRLRQELKTRYRPYYPVLVVFYNLGKGEVGEIELTSLEGLKFLGAEKKVALNGKSITVNGKGYLYFVFSPMPEKMIFKGGLLRHTPMQIPYSPSMVNEVTLNETEVNMLWNPFNSPFKGHPGFWFYITPVVSFVTDESIFPSYGAGEGMRQIMIEWGYIQK